MSPDDIHGAERAEQVWKDMTTTLPPLPPALANDGWSMNARIGGGGQADVYRVIRSNTPAALKIIKSPVSDVDRKRLQREIAVLARVDHPNVMNLIAHDGAADQPWLLMPLGETLHERWRRLRSSRGERVFPESLAFIRQIASGLQELHAQGYVHRDLKPKNVIIVEEVAKISDAGIIHDPSQERLTKDAERPIKLKFHRYSYSRQDPTREPPKWEDCLQVSWIWGWMLLQTPEGFGNYHWKYLTFVEEPEAELVVRPVMAQCSHDRTCPEDAVALTALIDSFCGVAESSISDASEYRSRIKSAGEQQRANAIIDKADRLETAEAAAGLATRLLQPIRETVWDTLKGLEGTDPEFKAHATVEPSIEDALMAVTENPMASPHLFQYQFGGQSTDRLVIKLRCLAPTSVLRGKEVAEQFFPFIFDLHVEHRTQLPNYSYALLVNRDGGLWQADWPSLGNERLTSPAEITRFILSAAADPSLRVVR